MIGALFNIPTTPQEFMRFAFHNNDAHVLAVRAIKINAGVGLPEYPLDPIPASDFASWLYTHQSAHNAVNEVLGISGNDLTDLDPTKPEEMTYWIQLHASEHVKWGDMLNYG